MIGLQFCKEPSDIGLDFIDNQAGFRITDTITIWSYTERDDSIPTSLTSQNLLGQMHDPIFGKVRASIFAQFSIPPSLYGDVSWGEDPELDSVLLVLAYSPKIGVDDDSTMYYGSLDILKTLRVFELAEPILNKDTIYSTRQVQGNHTLIGQKVFVPAPFQRFPFENDTLAYVSVKLSDDFGQKFIDADSINYSNWLRFHDFFKGLKIDIEDNFDSGGSILNFNINNFFTRLTVYYQSGEGEERKQTQRHFRVEGFSRKNTFVEHDFQNSHPLIIEQLNNPGQLSDSLLFASSLGGLRVRLQLPHIKSLSDVSNIVINQARLIVPVDTDFIDGKEFHAVHDMILLKIDSDGKVSSLRDQELSPNMFGGRYNRTEGQYEFNITQHLQQLIDGSIENDDLIMVVRGTAENAERVVLKSPGRYENPMKISIRYTYFE